MGGSLAIALRGRCAQLLGYDIDPQVVHQAQTQQVVEYASMQIDEVLPQADLIILAAPVNQILHLLQQLDGLHPEPAVVLDIGSTKRKVLEVMQALPARFDPLGGHPICGREKSSLAFSDAGIFVGAPFVLCKLSRTSGRACSLAVQLIESAGALPVWMDAEEHDRCIAATSHVPYLLSNALVGATPMEASELVGPGYRSTARLAASYAPMLLDVLETNLDMVLPALRAFRVALDQVEALVRNEDWFAMLEFLEANAKKYGALTQGLPLGSVTGGKGG